MPGILRQHVARKEIEGFPTHRARSRLDPQEILDVGVLSTSDKASRLVEVSYFLREASEQLARRLRVSLQIDLIDFFSHDPCRHRVDIRPDGVATDSVGFEHRRTAAHEWIGNRDAFEVVGSIVDIFNGTVPILRQQKTAEQRPRPACEPLMHCDERAVVLLNLLLTER